MRFSLFGLAVGCICTEKDGNAHSQIEARRINITIIGRSPIDLNGGGLAKDVLPVEVQFGKQQSGVVAMINLDAVKITPRDEEMLKLLAQGCSNKEIAGTLNISACT